MVTETKKQYKVYDTVYNIQWSLMTNVYCGKYLLNVKVAMPKCIIVHIIKPEGGVRTQFTYVLNRKLRIR